MNNKKKLKCKKSGAQNRAEKKEKSLESLLSKETNYHIFN